MSNRVKLEFEFSEFRKRLKVAWSVLVGGWVTILLSEEDFEESIMGLYTYDEPSEEEEKDE